MDTEQDRLRDEEGSGSHGGSTVIGHLACIPCRSRKLKCDRGRPNCDRCVKQGETCSYPGSKQRALGRRKTVRELEERIGTLKHRPGIVPVEGGQTDDRDTLAEELERLLSSTSLNAAPEPETGLGQRLPSSSGNVDVFETEPSRQPPMVTAAGPSGQQESANQLVDLGLFEQLPPFEVIDEL